MELFNRPFQEIDEAILLDFLDNKVIEKRFLEYKLKLNLKTKDNNASESLKREFRADITSFANELGGIFIIGVNDKIFEPIGIEIPNGLSKQEYSDKLRLQIEHVLMNRINPRLNEMIQFKFVDLSNGRIILLIYVPNSWKKPHCIWERDGSKNGYQFYGRNTGGKYIMDRNQIGEIFMFAGKFNEEMKKFRDGRFEIFKRIGKELITEQIPKFIIHIFPSDTFSPFGSNTTIDYKLFEDIGNIFLKNWFNLDSYTIKFNLYEECDHYIKLIDNKIIEIGSSVPWHFSPDRQKRKFKVKEFWNVVKELLNRISGMVLKKSLISYPCYF